MFTKLFLFCSIFFLWGCNSPTPKYEIGIDPSWYPLDFQERQTNVFGFSTELLTQISLEENIEFSILNTNWDSLLDGLTTQKYQAILSSLYPYNFNQNIYSFSEPFLNTGPVLVASIQTPELSLKDLSGKTIGVLEGSPEILMLEKDSTISIRSYASVPDTLNDLVAENIHAALLPALNATAYVDHLYFRKLKVASKPLNDQGLRLITLKEKEPKLLEKFNKALEHMKKNKSYTELISKWNLEE